MLEQSVNLFEKNYTSILKQVGKLFDIDPSKLNKLGSFESFVYEYEKKGKEYILKITHSFHRTREQILGELEWVNFLADGGVSVCGAYESAMGNLVESIAIDDSQFHVYTFDKAGGDFTNPDTWNEKVFESWGKVIGRMHRITNAYKPSRTEYTRHDWLDDPSLVVEECLPASQGKIIDKCHALKDKINGLPRERGSFGLIHSDLHQGNFKINNGTLTVFDFDDCHYNYYAFDLMIPVYYVLLSEKIGTDNISFADNFFRHFIAGYRMENKTESWWLSHIGDFLKLREIDLYSIITREKADEESPWCKRFMDGKKERIENDIPVIDLDFSKY